MTNWILKGRTQKIVKPCLKHKGFTLMEIMVATVIFAITASSMLALFNYVLKINRSSEALRQASQDMRNFMEFFVKEIRNGQIDYFVLNNGSLTDTSNPFTYLSPCGPPPAVGQRTYEPQSNVIALINNDNVQECFYYGDDTKPIPLHYSGFSAPPGRNFNLVMQKAGVDIPQILNPPNFRVDYLKFLIRPICDPYTPNCSDYGTNFPKVAPSVTIIMKAVVQLPTGEQVPIYYQTSVSSNKYDIPSH